MYYKQVPSPMNTPGWVGQQISIYNPHYTKLIQFLLALFGTSGGLLSYRSIHKSSITVINSASLSGSSLSELWWHSET